MTDSLKRLPSLAVVLALASPILGQPPQDPRLAKVVANWDSRRDRVVGVRYVLDGERVYFKGRTRDPNAPSKEQQWVPATDVTVKKQRSVVFDFPRNRFRIDLDDEEFTFPAGPASRTSEIHTFDGSVRKLWNRQAAAERAAGPEGEPKADIWVVKGGQSAYAGFDALLTPLFLAHANIEVGGAAIVPGRLKLRPDPELLTVHAEVRYDGRPVLVLRTRPERGPVVAYEEFWVDPNRESIIIRDMRYEDDEPRSDLTIRYQQTDIGWLPESWTETLYEEKRATDTTRVRITQLSLDPSPNAETFDIPAKPEMFVFKTTNRDHGKRINPPGESSPVEYYRVDAQGELRAVEFRNGVVIDKTTYWPWVVLTVGGLLVVWWLSRRLRKGRTKQATEVP